MESGAEVLATSTAAAALGGKEPPAPTWDGSDPGIELPIFEKNVKLWQYESELDKKKMGVRLLRNLSGIARSVADTLEFDEVACERGVENLIKALRDHFSPHLEISLPRAFERAVYGPPRGHKESMQEYLIRMERAFHLLEKEDLKLSEVAMGYVTYRQASLTESQELKFSTWSKGAYDMKTVTACLRKLERVVPEHKTKGGSASYMIDEDGESQEHYVADTEDAFEDDTVIFMEERDGDGLYEEDEVQVALATYQEVRKAINAQQKGRQYYGGHKGAGRGSGGFNQYFRGKKKMKIEELKLRTKCGRCGMVGHWAKECNNPPDGRGRLAMAKSSSTASSGPKSSSGATTSQQSWYVAAGSSICNSGKDSSSLWCGFNHHIGEELFKEQSQQCHERHALEENIVERGVLRGSSFCEVCPPVSSGAVYFVGLTTRPNLAVVDTAAQDGLIGSQALERLKENLADCGLKIAWTDKKARAHGVGGQAKVIGIAAIPLGIAESSGVLEATVVEGDVPLLLPIKMLRKLRSVVDVDHECVTFRALNKSVPMQQLASGHVAIDVLDFGSEGFKFPRGAELTGLRECDLRLDVGPICFETTEGLGMHPPCEVRNSFVAVNHGVSKPPCFLQASLQSKTSGVQRSTYARRQDEESEEGAGSLASSSGQGLCAAASHWLRGVGELVVTSRSGRGRHGFHQGVTRAVGRVHQDSKPDEAADIQGGTSIHRGGVQASQGAADSRREPVGNLGDMQGMQLKVGCNPESSGVQEEGKQVQGEPERGWKCRPGEDEGGLGRDDEPRIRGQEGGRASPTSREAGHGEATCPRSSRRSEAGPGKAEDRDGRTLSLSCSRGAMGTSEAEGGSPDLQHRDAGVWHETGAQVPGVSGLLRHGDVPVLRGEVQSQAGDFRVAGLSGRAGDADLGQSGSGGSNGCFGVYKEESEEGVEVEVNFGSEETTWVKLQGGSLKEKVESMQSEDGLVRVQAIYEQHEGRLLEIEAEELDGMKTCVLELGGQKRLALEDAVDEEPETALPKKVKTKLRKAHAEVEKTQKFFQVDLSEVYSPPRIVQTASRSGLRCGGSYDIKTGYDLNDGRDYERMWKELVRDDPELICTCPPCTPFSILQELNFPKMDWEDALWLVGEGVHHVQVSAEVCWWQHRRGKLFAFEHPRTSKAWREEEIERLILEPGVHVCYIDMCAYGMKVKNAPNRKPTMWITNSWDIARELQRRCTRDHQHEALMGGKAVLAQIYPEGLCKAIVRGLKRHLRRKNEAGRPYPEEMQEVFVGDEDIAAENGSEAGEEEAPRDEDLEDALDREVEDLEDPRSDRPRRDQVEEEEKKKERQRRGEEGVAVSEEDKRKIRKLHVNLGHPSLPSFLRFLKAGRVREEVRSWVRRSFQCATCQAQQTPKAPRPAVVPKCYSPGVVVGIDVFYIPDHTNTKSLPIMSMVDIGTNYQMVEYVENKEPERLWATFWKVWARTFGTPQYVTVDEGREFRGGFTRLCGDAGVVMFRAAARAPWQQGKVERHGGVFKMMMEKSREEMPPTSHEELVQLLYACESAKNRFSNRSGYSPTQRQIGQWPRMPCSLLSDEEIDPALQSQNNTEAFQRLLEFRQIAMEAFAKVSSREAAAKALKARPRVQLAFSAGDVVYVYRVLRRQKTVHGAPRANTGHGMGRKATWVGPGYVLATEGSVIWVNMMGELWKAAAEQVRPATTSEKMGVEMVNESVPEMQERLKRSSHRAGFRDITKEEFPEMETIDGEGEEGAEDGDEVEREGRDRGLPRPRVEEPQGQAEEEEDEETSETEESTEGGEAPMQPQDTGQTEPEGEAGTLGAAEMRDDSEEERNMVQQMVRTVAHNQRLDGVPATPAGSYEAMRGRWRQRPEKPYFAEFSVFFEDEAEEEGEEEEHLKKDYWVFDQHKKVLQRHHVTWRRAKFNPSQASGSPIPLRAIKKKRKTQRMQNSGQLKEDEDEWSLFTEKEIRYDWWKGITEFEIDEHFLYKSESEEEKKGREKGQKSQGGAKKKRGEGEVFPHEIGAEEWPLWQVEDKAEFEKILKSGALRLMSLEESVQVRRQLEAENKTDRILPSRMVRRYKPAEQPGDPRTRKSRFCIRGDRDPDAIYLNRFAPTVTTSNLQVLIQAAVNRGFKGSVGDLKSAFTQSRPLVRGGGKLYCRSCQGSMPGTQEGQLAEIVLGCYGLMDAPLNWRKTLVEYITKELGYVASVLDPCTFFLHDREKGLRGMLAVEVDDLLMFGDEEHEKKMQELQRRFTFGKIEELGEKGVGFNGRRLKKIGSDIRIDMQAFVEERLHPVELEPGREKQKQEAITEEERSKVRSSCGALNWAGREGRPDAAAAASMFSSQIQEMRIEHILELNKVISQLKKDSQLALRIQPICEERMRWGVISDASFANAKNGKTQAGHMLVTFDKALLEGGEAVTNLLHWRSGKLQRTVNSTLAAETQSLARGVGDLLWMRVMYLELTVPDFQVRNWRRHIGQQGYVTFNKKKEGAEDLEDALAVVDAKSLYDLLINETTGGSDRRTALDVQMLREELRELGGKIRWIEHMQMPADCLTKKHGRSDALKQLLNGGTFGITEESKTLENRLDIRKQSGYNRR